jgi:hypothetical protein
MTHFGGFMLPFQEWFIELIQMLSNLLVGIAAIVGIAGIWKWQSETIGKARFEVARDMIRTALQFRDEFKSTRNPLTLPQEWAEREKKDGESVEESSVRNEVFARGNRLSHLQQTMRKLLEIGWEAETILSEDDAKLIQPFGDLFKELSIAFDMYFRDRYDVTQGLTTDRLFTMTMKEKVYGVDNDEPSNAVDNAMETMKRQLKKYILK